MSQPPSDATAAQDFSSDAPAPSQHSTPAPTAPMSNLAADDAMEGIESQTSQDPSQARQDTPAASSASVNPDARHQDEAMVTEEARAEEDAEAEPEQEPEVMEVVPKKLTYTDYLKSPTISLQIGTPPADETLTAHQLLLLRSPFFAAQISDMTHSTPADTRTVSLPDEEISSVSSFLEFLYTGEYRPRLLPVPGGRPDEQTLEEVETDEVDEEGDALLKHAKMYTLAEKLGLPELKTLAHSKIHRINSTAKGELAYARFVYANTPKEDQTIRKPIATFWAHRSHVLRHEAEDDFRTMVLEYPQFAYDILSIVLDQKEKGKHRHGAAAAAAETDDGGDGGSQASAAFKVPMTPHADKPRAGRKRPRTSNVP